MSMHVYTLHSRLVFASKDTAVSCHIPYLHGSLSAILAMTIFSQLFLANFDCNLLSVTLSSVCRDIYQKFAETVCANKCNSKTLNHAIRQGVVTDGDPGSTCGLRFRVNPSGMYQ